MASSLNGTDDELSSVDHCDVLVGNLQRLRSHESFNDVQFSLRDGTVRANSVILSMSSDYFATMISNDKFIEGQTKDIPMKEYGTKKAMESIVEYIYSGKMNLTNQGLETLLEILNIAEMMLMKTNKLSSSIEKYIKEIVPHVNFGSLVRGFMLVDRYGLENIRKIFVHNLYFAAADEDQDLIFNDENRETFKQLPLKMVKEIITYKYEDLTLKKWKIPTTKERLNYFMIWYSTNKANGEDMKIIVDSFNLGDFSGPELLTVVKQTGLFSVEEIDKKCIEKFGSDAKCNKCGAKCKKCRSVE